MDAPRRVSMDAVSFSPESWFSDQILQKEFQNLARLSISGMDIIANNVFGITDKIKDTFQNQNINILFPLKEMMSDNAAMVAWNCLNKNITAVSNLHFKANPRLSIK